jgi:Tol biopolymer transport system component
VAITTEASNLASDDTNNTWDVFVTDRQMGVTERVSIVDDGTEGNNVSGHRSPPTLSAEGRYVAFVSWASNLVADDSNGVGDIFVHDRQTGETEQISLGFNGIEANGESTAPFVSADGRYIVFDSEASNLIPNDTNEEADIFIYDRQTRAIERLSVSSDGLQGNGQSRHPSLSADGRWVVFVSLADNLVKSDTNSFADVFIHDRQTGRTVRVSETGEGIESNDRSTSPRISADGYWVVFASLASNLVSDDTNGAWDIFLRDVSALHVE